MLTDAEAYDEIRTQYGDSWRGRDGEIIRRFIVRTGLTIGGRVLERGTMVELEVGSDDWIATVDPTTGKSALELDPTEQLERWGVRYYDVIEADETIVTAVETPDPYTDDKPNRPPTSPRRKMTPRDVLQSIYREQDALTDGPLRVVSAERRFLKDGTEF